MRLKLALLWMLRRLHLISVARYEQLRGYIQLEYSPLFDRGWYLATYRDVSAHHKDPVWHYCMHGWKEGRSPCAKANGRILTEFIKGAGPCDGDPLDWIFAPSCFRQYRGKEFPAGTVEGRVTFHRGRRGGRTAVFAMYSPDGRIRDSVIYYLRGLAKVVDNIILVADNPVFPQELRKIRGVVCACWFTRHEEYDFGSYKRGRFLMSLDDALESSKSLLFCNDSCFGPVTEFSPIFKDMDSRGLDFWGMCENDEIMPHIQSYFLCFTQSVFRSSVFAKFMASIRKCAKVSDVVREYEVKFASTLSSAGFKGGVLVACGDSKFLDRAHFCHNPVHYPITLLELGMPLVKVKAFKQVRSNLEGVEPTRAAVAQRNPRLAALIDAEIPRQEVKASFSVIVPTYNRVHCISRQLDALLAHTYRDFEIIIVDDGSTDGTESFIQDHYADALADGRIRYFVKKNEGVCRARNYGLSHATREWIAYADSDNEVYPNFLETFANAIAANPNTRTFYGRFKMNCRGAVIGKEFSFERLLAGNFIDLGVFVHHRSVTETCGLFDTEMTRLVDWDLIVRYTEKYPPVYIPQVLMLYDDRDSGTRISTKCSYAVNLNHMRQKRGPSFIVTTMITAYNHEKYIAQALESAVKQKGNFVHEILVSSDGSTDGTREVIRSFQRRFPLLITDISDDVNVGVSANMKRCFDAAHGKYIAVLEGDDYWCSNEKLSKQVAFMEAHPGFTMMFSRINILNEKTGSLSLLPRQSGLVQSVSGEDFINDPNQNLIANFSCCLFATWAIRRLPSEIYAERFNEITLAFSIERLGPIGFLPDVMTVYRIHVGSTWSTADKRRQLESGIRIRELALQLAAPKYRERLQVVIDKC